MGNNSRFYFALLSVAAAVCISNLFLYPYLSFKFTGLFFIPYITALILVGIPLLMLEFSIGQYFSRNVVDLFSYVRKWFSSIGWLMAINALILMSIYAAVFAWHIIYIFVSFGLQWKPNAREYFFNNVVQVSNGFNSFAKFSLPVFIALILAWVLIFFYIRKGYESIKKNSLVVFSLLVALMLFFLFYALTFDNALSGIYAFLRPDFRALLDFKLWIAAFSLAFVSLGISFGIMPLLSQKTRKGFLLGNSIIVVSLKLAISMIMGFIMFALLGFLSYKTNIGIGGLAYPDYNFPFVVLSQAFAFINSPLIGLLFFAFLALFFFIGASFLAYSMSKAFLVKLRTNCLHASIIVSGFGFLTGLIFAIKPGFYIMDIASHFIFYNILIAVLLESVAIGWFANSEKIAGFVNQHSKIKIGSLWRFIIRYAIPLILFGLIAFQLKSDIFEGYHSYPLWALLVFGLGTVVAPLVIAFLLPQKILDRKQVKKQ